MPIWKTKYGWRTRVQVKGEKTFGPTFQFKHQARQWCQDQKELQKNKAANNQDISELLSLTDDYLDHAKLSFSHNTYLEKLGALERLLLEVGNVDPREVTPAQVIKVLDKRAAEQSNNAANKDRKNIKAFFAWLGSIHGITHDPTGPTKQLPHSKKSRRLIPIPDIFAVIMAAPMPERALIACYWHTGARQNEILRLTWADDVNLTERWVRLGTKKNRAGAMSYTRMWINDDLLDLLKRLWETRDKSSPYLFPYYYQPNPAGENLTGRTRAHRLLAGYKKQLKAGLKRYPGLCEKAGVEPFNYHDMRHTVAKYLNDIQKVGLKKVQQVLRHRRQGTTEIYIDGEYTDARPALELLTRKSVDKTSQRTSQAKETKG